ncbi:MAG: transcriptional repressor [Deltaproteobacteria bacterium]|nr:transcriptional repressor [Deltaproteobacteria bacterium]
MKKSNSQLNEKLEAFVKRCRDNGIKVTHQRMEIFREIALSDTHPSVEDIYHKLRSKLPMISLDTVYRTLSTFEQIGILSKVSVWDNKGRFDSNIIPHHHLICTRCKGIMDFYWPTFDTISLPTQTKKWGKIMAKQVELRGVCEECMGKSKKTK